MPKRPCNYQAFTRQSKKRITEKEVTYASTNMLKSLSEKTVQKLFDGARSHAKGVDGNQNIDKHIQKTCSSCHCMAASICENCTSYLCYDCRNFCNRCVEVYCQDCLHSSRDQALCLNCS